VLPVSTKSLSGRACLLKGRPQPSSQFYSHYPGGPGLATQPAGFLSPVVPENDLGISGTGIFPGKKTKQTNKQRLY